MDESRVQIPKVWRSEFVGLLAYGLLCGGAIALSHQFPGSVITGKLFGLTSGSTLYLSLPLYWLVPFGWLMLLIVRMYNVYYIADTRGIEAYEGILSLQQTVTKVRYEDVRSIEFDQSLMERLLDVGELEIGTAGLSGLEMILCGISSPRAVQEFIQNERDRRLNFSPDPSLKNPAVQLQANRS